jgi:4-amino-4-deoxy-L-arabinose transferase-like glycosyltransferase
MTKRVEFIALTVLLLIVAFSRFYQLGYSDYILDEPGTFMFRGLPEQYDMTSYEFIMSQRKGPLQILVGYIPHLFVGNYNNELAQRIPFSIFNVASVLVFYLLIKRVANNKLVGLLGALLFGINGFVVAFGRVAQYQSLNLFFSILALYLYSHLLVSRHNVVKYTLAGTLSYSLSILAHWDAVYILPAIIFIFTKFLRDNGTSRGTKFKVLITNVALGSLFLLPFLVPYLTEYSLNTSNQEYFATRIGFRESFDNAREVFRFKLFNPFLAFELYLIFGLIGLGLDSYNAIKGKGRFAGMFTFWFVFTLVVFKFFVPHAGTHIYNLVIPAVALAAVGIKKITDLLPKDFWPVTLITVVLVFFFLYFQSYLVFVDPTKQYPWEREKILGHKTRKYTHEDNIRHLIGFPLRRNWKEINKYVVGQNEKNGEVFGYISNEEKGISSFYMKVDHRDHDGFYAIGIKRPMSFENDYKFPQIKGKETVHRIKLGDENVVRIYRIEE